MTFVCIEDGGEEYYIKMSDYIMLQNSQDMEDYFSKKREKDLLELLVYDNLAQNIGLDKTKDIMTWG